MNLVEILLDSNDDRFVCYEMIADTVSGYWYYDTDEQDYVFVPADLS